MPAIAIPVAYWAVGGLLALAGTVAWQRSGGPEKAAQAIDNAIANMSGADEEAEAQANAQPLADTCTGDCPPPPRCRDLEDGMRRDSETIQRRINDMKADQHNLFDNHYYEWQAHPQLGSWKGHERQIRQVQKSLENKRKESERIGCPKPSSGILQWLRSNAPTAPRGK